MIKYKRGVSNIANIKNTNFCMSNGKDVYLFMNGLLNLNAPYQGMYIKKDKILLSNIIEKVEVGNKEYKILGVTNNLKHIDSEEYVLNVDLENYTFEYAVDNVVYKKKIDFMEYENSLVIQYEITNNSKSKVKFMAIPFVTFRGLLETKTFNKLNFNQRDTDYGQVIALSVMEQENLVLKSIDAKFIKKQEYIKNIKYEYMDKLLERHILSDDLYIPGLFEVSLKPGETKVVNIYVSDKDTDITKENLSLVTSNYNEIKKDIVEEYVELRDLIQTVQSFSNDDLTCEIPNISKKKIDIDSLTNLIKSIEGQYLVINKVKDAKVRAIKIKKAFETLDMPDSEEKIVKYLKFRLWYIETVNRILAKSTNINDLDTFFDIVKNMIEEVLAVYNSEKNILNDIESVLLIYNALKIYENLLAEKKLELTDIYSMAEKIRETIETKYWSEEKRLLKYKLDEEMSISRAEMIYAISLSYPCVTGDIPIKLLDTIFKELYTPYGLREYAKNRLEESSYIYPKYMAHFVKANLRQNGVTRASQKISYNLVKELLLDINKELNGTVKRVYHDKGKKIENTVYDLYTISEVIRLYDMLT